MSRETDADFELLKQFLNNYSLTGLGQSKDKLILIKASHKSYLPLLQLWSICADKASKDSFLFFGKKINNESQELLHLREAVSDIGSGLFCYLHGAYKPGHMALRSSIENFLRFAAAPFDNRALTTTSIYDLFDLSRNTVPFADSRKRHIDQMRSDYVQLCKYTHSASLAHMAGVHALAHFPSFNQAAFQEWLSLAKTCMSAIGAVIAVGNPSTYIDAHFSAKELLELLIPQQERLTLLRGEAG
jgi:hypothetical protein